MFTQEATQKTIVELRNAMSTLRDTPVNQININALELVMAHALVDLTLAAEIVSQQQHRIAELEERRNEDSNVVAQGE